MSQEQEYDRYNIQTASILIDTVHGQDTALIEPHTVVFSTVTEQGVDLLLTTGAAITLKCDPEAAIRVVRMIGDVKGAQRLEREREPIAQMVRQRDYFDQRDPATPEVHALMRRVMHEARVEGKISAIKKHRELFGTGLKDAKDAVEAEAEKWGIEFP